MNIPTLVIIMQNAFAGNPAYACIVEYLKNIRNPGFFFYY
jgi:hypothetical protein